MRFQDGRLPKFFKLGKCDYIQCLFGLEPDGFPVLILTWFTTQAYVF